VPELEFIKTVQSVPPFGAGTEWRKSRNRTLFKERVLKIRTSRWSFRLSAAFIVAVGVLIDRFS
jgi:hypothetical protein